jgi:hypothetical protein
MLSFHLIAPNLQQRRELRKLFLRLQVKTMETNHYKIGPKNLLILKIMRHSTQTGLVVGASRQFLMAFFVRLFFSTYLKSNNLTPLSIFEIS